MSYLAQGWKWHLGRNLMSSADKSTVALDLQFPETWDWRRNSQQCLVHMLPRTYREHSENVPRTLPTSLQYVQSVSDSMGDMLTRHFLGPQNIWNTVDETDFKQVGSPAWDQPPHPCRARGHVHTKHAHFIFPRVHFHDHFYNNGPPLSKGGANPKGWMKEAHFVDFLKPFVEGTCQVLAGEALFASSG